jgi:hypothetical protein
VTSGTLRQQRLAAIASPKGLRIAVRSTIRERPHTIWRPLERGLPDDGRGSGQLGFATVVISIRRWIEKRYLIHHGYLPHKSVAQRFAWLRHQTRKPERPPRAATSVPLLCPQFTEFIVLRYRASVQNCSAAKYISKHLRDELAGPPL